MANIKKHPLHKTFEAHFAEGRGKAVITYQFPLYNLYLSCWRICRLREADEREKEMF